jgi:hypothetical protein
VELENRYYEKCKAFQKELEKILKQIESEIPLRGYCDICKDIPKNKRRLG